MNRQSFLLTSASALAGLPIFGGPALAGVTSLGAAAAAKGAVYGTNIEGDLINSAPELVCLMTDQCRLAINGIAFEWRALRPTPTTFDFTKADAFAAWTQRVGLQLGECHLMWHRGQAAWQHGFVNAANWRNVLVDHISTVVSRYAGKMDYWVVVNEAIRLKDGRPDGLRDQAWTQLGGQEAIDLAFRTAAAADPTAQLVYNDDDLEEGTPSTIAKRKVLLDMVRGMRSRGVPIHAVGMQGHLVGNRPFKGVGLGAFIDDLNAAGVKVFVTELDADDGGLPADDSRDTTIADVYKNFLDIVLARKNVTRVVQWSLAEKYYWRNGWVPDGKGMRRDRQPNRGLPFGSVLEPTPIYQAVLLAFESAPNR